MAKILVVDDEEAIREVLARRLRQWGHQVMTVSSATSALETMKVSPFPIVFCDVVMPHHDGVWLLEQLTAHWPQTVVVSGAREFGTVIRIHRLGGGGVVNYISKPVGREMLHKALEKALTGPVPA